MLNLFAYFLSLSFLLGQYLTRYFNASDWVLRYRTPASALTQFADYYCSRLDTSVIAIRGTVSSLDAFVDLKMMSDVALLELVPALNYLGDALFNEMVYFLSFAEWLLSPSDLYTSTKLAFYDEVVNYTAVAASDRHVLLTGHSLGGFMSKFVAAKTSTPAVAFAGPGLLWSLKRFGPY
jgi:hypothetical protein